MTYGLTIGVGVQGDNLQQIDTSTDLSLLGTLGYEWLRFSAGVACTSGIVSLAGVGEDNKTLDQNVLNRAERDRRARFVFALHAAP